jgi:hypothetical protein
LRDIAEIATVQFRRLSQEHDMSLTLQGAEEFDVDLGGVTKIELTVDEAMHLSASLRVELGHDLLEAPSATTVSYYFDVVELIEALLPARIRRALSGLRDGLLDAVVLDGLPQDPDPRIRSLMGMSSWPWLGYAWLGMVARHVGHEFSYANEKQGRLVHDIVPDPNFVQSQSNEGYSAGSVEV